MSPEEVWVQYRFLLHCPMQDWPLVSLLVAFAVIEQRIAAKVVEVSQLTTEEERHQNFLSRAKGEETALGKKLSALAWHITRLEALAHALRTETNRRGDPEHFLLPASNLPS